MTIGLVRGVLSPLITFFSLLASVWLVTFLLSPCQEEVAVLLRPWEGNFLVTLLTSKFVVGFLLILIIYFLLSSLAEFVKRKLMNALNLRFSDRFMGMLCGTGMGLFACVMLCVGLLWARTLVEAQANSEGLQKYDSIMASSQGYMASMAAVDWVSQNFPQTRNLLPNGCVWPGGRVLEEDWDEEEERGLINH